MAQHNQLKLICIYIYIYTHKNNLYHVLGTGHALSKSNGMKTIGPEHTLPAKSSTNERRLIISFPLCIPDDFCFFLYLTLHRRQTHVKSRMLTATKTNQNARDL